MHVRMMSVANQGSRRFTCRCEDGTGFRLKWRRISFSLQETRGAGSSPLDSIFISSYAARSFAPLPLTSCSHQTPTLHFAHRTPPRELSPTTVAILSRCSDGTRAGCLAVWLLQMSTEDGGQIFEMKRRVTALLLIASASADNKHRYFRLHMLLRALCGAGEQRVSRSSESAASLEERERDKEKEDDKSTVQTVGAHFIIK